MNNDSNFVTLKTSLLTLHTDRPIIENANKLKGYIAKLFREYPIFHNHYGGRCIFTDSRVHYMVVSRVGYILGIEEGAEAIKMLSDISELHLGNSIYKVRPTFCDKEERIAKTDELIQYDLVVHWIPFNDENYEISKTLKDQKEKKLFINDILRGNIISLCKGFGFNVEKKRYPIYVHTRLKETRSMYKVLRPSFIGEFRTNIIIPDFFGIGEKVSAGFGVIKRRLDNNHYLTTR
jgi:hypothetical protein